VYYIVDDPNEKRVVDSITMPVNARGRPMVTKN
jgi:hypothetical protein